MKVGKVGRCMPQKERDPKAANNRDLYFIYTYMVCLGILNMETSKKENLKYTTIEFNITIQCYGFT